MIFVCLGTQKFNLNRLLQEIDTLIENGDISEEVYAQLGFSDYKPKHFQYTDFLSQDEFDNYIKKSSFVIMHGGVGSIISALKKNKKVIVYPRLAAFNEHVDDHQCEISNKFANLGFCLTVSNEHSLKDCVREVHTFNSKYICKKGNDELSKIIVSFIEGYIK